MLIRLGLHPLHFWDTIDSDINKAFYIARHILHHLLEDSFIRSAVQCYIDPRTMYKFCKEKFGHEYNYSWMYSYSTCGKSEYSPFWVFQLTESQLQDHCYLSESSEFNFNVLNCMRNYILNEKKNMDYLSIIDLPYDINNKTGYCNTCNAFVDLSDPSYFDNDECDHESITETSKRKGLKCNACKKIFRSNVYERGCSHVIFCNAVQVIEENKILGLGYFLNIILLYFIVKLNYIFNF